MKSLRNVANLAVGMVALTLFANAVPAADASADEAAVRAVNPAWFKAFNAGDVDGVVALYADDAVLSIPGMAPVRGLPAIREAYVKDIAASKGLTNLMGQSGDFDVSGDIAWEWNTFSVTDKSGTVVSTGKYLTVYGKKDGKWRIVRDMWNTDKS